MTEYTGPHLYQETDDEPDPPIIAVKASIGTAKPDSVLDMEQRRFVGSVVALGTLITYLIYQNCHQQLPETNNEKPRAHSAESQKSEPIFR